ncbi:tyrosine-type recombinase/integrase [Phaeobacter marinintestinus]|uniref:tyrosine-type recombinase/integrase n=1 Tax=Falsiphaeobacter marinintestinus TaxID=1492905 RepID=UPI0011B363E8|nr:tyrosine-type recombinase/integrase [Phaeobacter marinintestinus]
MATVTKLPSGKTRVVIRRKGVYRSASFDKVREAKSWALKNEAAIDADFHGIKKKVQHAQLGDLIEKYNDETPTRGESTIKTRRSWIRKFGSQPLKQIDKPFGRRIVAEYTKTSEMPHAILNLKGLARIIKWGRTVLNLDISEAPLLQVIDDIKFSGHKMHYAPRKTIMTEEELQAFVEFFRNQGRKGNFDELLLFLADSGMRIGEATRVVGADVSLDNRSIVIRDRKHPTKKLGNHQEVPLIGDAWEIAKRKVEAGEMGKLFPLKYPSQRFVNAGVKIGLRHCRLHDIRRLFVQRCYDKGLQPHIVAIATGHTKLATLMTHYSDLKVDDFHRALGDKK